MLLQFFYPYITLCQLASWGLSQNLEGLGLFKYLNTSPMHVGNAIFYPLNLNPVQGVTHLALFLTGVLIVVFLLNIRACFYLNKWLGWIGLVLWVFPGLLSMFGHMPDMRSMGPDVFRYGVGFPGGMESAAANLLVCLVAGWSLILLLSSRCDRDKFKNIYDHIWYTMGLITMLYFVVDAGLPFYKQDLIDTDSRMVRTVQLFHAAEKRLEILCALPEAAGLSPTLCAMDSELKWGTNSYLDMDGKIRAKIDPLGWVSKLASNLVLENQIEALNNWACGQGHQPTQCQNIPQEAALSIHDIDTPMVFPPPRYAQEIQKLHSAMEKTDQRTEDIERGHNLRYFGFLIVALLAGGKLANASRAMVKKKESLNAHSWMLIAITYGLRNAMVLLKGLATLISVLCRRLARYASALIGRYQKAEVARLKQQKTAASEQKLSTSVER